MTTSNQTLPPDFPWRPGMLTLQYGVPARLVGQDEQGRWHAWDNSGVWLRYASMDGIEVDPNDGATLGALLAAVREAYELPDLYVSPLLPGGWTTARPAHGSGVSWCAAWAPTEFATLLAAWNARPGRSA